MALLDHQAEDLHLLSPAAAEASDRQLAMKRLEAKRRLRVEAVVAALAAAFLVLVWALSEYHNAGGWPTDGLSQSSGIHDVWNYWIIYPLMGIALVLGGRAWFVFRRRTPSESEIEREMDRQKRGR